MDNVLRDDGKVNSEGLGHGEDCEGQARRAVLGKADHTLATFIRKTKLALFKNLIAACRRVKNSLCQ